MSTAALAKHGGGSLSNVVTVDACRISDTYLIPALHWGTWGSALIGCSPHDRITSSPMTLLLSPSHLSQLSHRLVIIALYNLYSMLGISAFVGFGVLLGFWPVNLFMFRFQKVGYFNLP